MIKSSPFSSVVLTGEDAAAFRRQVAEGEDEFMRRLKERSSERKPFVSARFERMRANEQFQKWAKAFTDEYANQKAQPLGMFPK